MDPEVNLPPQAQASPPEPPPNLDEDLDEGPVDWPPPPEEEIEQWRWIYQGYEDKSLLPYVGQHIAVVNKQVIASHPSAWVLHDILRKEFHLDPDRVVIAFID